MSDDIVTRVNRIDSRLSDVETLLYGDKRTNRPGFVQEVSMLTEAIRRQTIVLWFVTVAMIITVIAVALAVLL